MSSTERAPEPTMEEILASIRRIISDEDASAPQEAEPAADDYPVRTVSADTDYEVADTQIIDDIARVLSGGGAPAEAGAEMSDDDILDLTDLGEPIDAAPGEELVLVEETVETMEADVPYEAAPYESASYEPAPYEPAPYEPAPYEADAPRKPDFSSAFPPSDHAASDQAMPEAAMEEEMLADAFPVEAVAAEESVTPEPMPTFETQAIVEEVVTAAPLPQSLEDPTSALERAIAALKAGDLSAFAREADPSFGLSTPVAAAPTEPVQVEPEPVPEPEPTVQAHPVLAAEDEPLTLEEPFELEAAGLEPEATPSWTEDSADLAEAEMIGEPEPTWSGEDNAWSRAQPTPIKEFLPNGQRTNGGRKHHHEFEAPVSSKSLEDSVKEMLRPMLRQWLDENMNRVLTAALREELENPPASSSTRRGN